jgi:hypothetical protein
LTAGEIAPFDVEIGDKADRVIAFVIDITRLYVGFRASLVAADYTSTFLRRFKRLFVRRIVHQSKRH